MSKKIDRRNFFKNTAISATGLIVAKGISGLIPSANASPSSPPVFYSKMMEEVMKYRKIDAHEHIAEGTPFEAQIDIADRLGIDKLVISRPISAHSNKKATPEEVRECNDLVLRAMKQYPDRYLGELFINPIYQKESMEEIERCIDNGMIALKFYNQVKINSPLFYPIIEKFIDLKMVMMGHAHCGLGVGGFRTKYGNDQPNASVPEDFAEASKRYPEAMFQYAHTGGGGDWEHACKVLRDCANVYVDLSGSNNEGNMVDFALRYIGEDRLLFGTDGSYYQGVGVILGAKLTEGQKRKIFFENFNNILRKAGNHVD